jgi:hypothetical protein
MSLQKTLFTLLPLALLITACGSSDQAPKPLDLPQNNQPGEIRTSDRSPAKGPGLNAQSPIADGEYPVQQATFDDADGEYTLMLLNAPSSSFRTKELQMARLTDEQIKEGKKSYLKVENKEPVFYLTEDFKISYVHNVSEERTNPTTGRTESTVVRQESNFWSPFAGSMAGSIAGQAIGSMLFRPQHYMPPQFQSGGGPMMGYGGYGRTYGDAVGNYQQRYNQPPTVEQNRTVLRTNGNIRANGSDRDAVKTPRDTTNRDRSTGSGFGSSDLKNGKTPQNAEPRSGGSFGSGRSSRSRGLGRRSSTESPSRFNVKTARNSGTNVSASRSQSRGSLGSTQARRSSGSFGSGRSSGGSRGRR